MIAISNEFHILSKKHISRSKQFFMRIIIKILINSEMDTHSVSNCLGVDTETVARWNKRETIEDLTRSGRPIIYGQSERLAITGFYCQTKPFEEFGRWTLRFAAQYLKMYPEIINIVPSKSTIQRILNEDKLKPHRSKYFLHISDPDFFPKMRHIINLYANPPKNFYSFDECPGIQVLQRLVPDLQTDETKILLEEFEYIRNGTIDVFAFYNVNNAQVHVDCRANHTKDTLIEVFEKHLIQVVENDNEKHHYIMDNLYSHCCYDLCLLIAKYCKIKCPEEKELNNMEKRREWLAKSDKRIIFHYTPFHGSWLNKIEIWFGILNSKCLKESYMSADELYRAIYKFTEIWNVLEKKPIKWEYTGEGLQAKAILRFSKMLDQVIKIDSRVLVKMIKLMKNLVSDEWESASLDLWKNLHLKLNEKSEDIIVNINKRPLTLRNSELIIFEDLLFFLNHKIEKNIKKVA